MAPGLEHRANYLEACRNAADLSEGCRAGRARHHRGAGRAPRAVRPQYACGEGEAQLWLRPERDAAAHARRRRWSCDQRDQAPPRRAGGARQRGALPLDSCWRSTRACWCSIARASSPGANPGETLLPARLRGAARCRGAARLAAAACRRLALRLLPAAWPRGCSRPASPAATSWVGLQRPWGGLRWLLVHASRCRTRPMRWARWWSRSATSPSATWRRTAAQSSLAVEQSPIGILVCDTGGRIEYVNDALARITRWPRHGGGPAPPGLQPLDAAGSGATPRWSAGARRGLVGEFTSVRRGGEAYDEFVHARRSASTTAASRITADRRGT